MKPIKEIRRENLRLILDSVLGQSALAERLRKDRNQVYQWTLDPKGPDGEKNPHSRGISDASARAIEDAAGLAIGWMDHQQQGFSKYPEFGSAEPISVREETTAYPYHAPGKRAQVKGIAVVDAQGQAQVTEEEDGYFIADIAGGNAYCLRLRGPGATFVVEPGWYVLLAPNSNPEANEKVVAKLKDGRYLVGAFDRRDEDEMIIRRPNGQLEVLTVNDVEYVHPIHGHLSPKQLRR